MQDCEERRSLGILGTRLRCSGIAVATRDEARATNAPKGKRYALHFNALLKDNELNDIPKTTRAAAIKCGGRLGLIEQHREISQPWSPQRTIGPVRLYAEHAARLPRQIEEKMLIDMVRYDVGRFTNSLADLRVPVMAILTTYNNERRERRSLTAGQSTPYLSMLAAQIPWGRIAMITETGHFPQIGEPTQTNALLDSFIASLPAG